MSTVTGTANNTSVAGGSQTIAAGGVANATSVLAGGMSTVTGMANNTTVAGGSQTVTSGGVANATTINQNGIQSVLSGGITNGATANGGGVEVNAGSAVGSTLNGGGTLTNSGVASQGSGGFGVAVAVTSGATITNSGTISGTGFGVFADAGAPTTITNSGTISASNAVGVAIDLTGGGTVTNAGTIVGGSTGQAITGVTHLTINPGQVIQGGVQGASGSTLELAGNNGTLGGLGAQYTGFGTVQLDSGQTWTLAGASTLGNAATLVLGAGSTLVAGGALTDTTSGTIAFQGDSVLSLAGSTTGLTVTGLTALDRIDLTNISFASADTITKAGNVVTVSDANGHSDAITITGAAGENFALGSMAGGGSVLTVKPVIASLSAHPDASGTLAAGNVITFDLLPNVPLTIDTTRGVPSLGLSDGGTATYDGTASNSGTLVFRTTVLSGQNTTDLKVNSFSFGNATLVDTYGSPLDATSVAPLAGSDTGIAILTTPPFVPDTTPPNAPANLVLDPGSDSGVAGDGITNVVAATITGSAEAGSTVRIYDNAGTVASGAGTASTTGLFSITTTLASGANTLTATATDAAGNTSVASMSLGVTLDTLPPAAPAGLALTASSDSGTSSTDGVTNVALPTLTGTAEAGSTIRLFENSMVVGTTTASASGSFTINSATSLRQGLNILSATATDVAGNTSANSAGVNVRYEGVAPVAPTSIMLDRASDSGFYTFDGVTNVALPQIDLFIPAQGSVNTDGRIVVYDGTTEIASTAAANLFNSVTLTATHSLTEGVNVLTAKVIDGAGNVSTSSASATIVLDTAPPAAPTNLGLTLASDSGVKSDNVTNNTMPDITGTTEPGSSVSLYEVSNATLTQLNLSYSSTDAGVFSFIPGQPFADGVHVIEAIATDIAGNTSPASAAYTLTVDTLRPVISSITSTRSAAGTLTTGGVLKVALAVNAAVTLDPTGGAPTLLLNNGLTAYFDAAASTATSLVFDHQVLAGESDADVTVTGVAISGADFADFAGNRINYSAIASVAGANTGVVISTAVVVTAPPSALSVTTMAGAKGGTVFTTLANASNSVTTTATGNDVVNALGSDTVLAGGGFNTVYASGPVATVTGGTGNLTFVAGAGNYVAGGGTGVDILYGGNGSSVLTGGAAKGSIIVAGFGNTSLVGGAGSSVLAFGGFGASTFTGSVGGSDTLVGGAGANTFNMTNGGIAFGGPNGPDTYNTGSGSTLIVEGPGRSQINVGSGLTTDFAGTGTDTYTIKEDTKGIANIIGFKAGDHITLIGGFTSADASSAVSTATVGSFGTALKLSDGSTVNLFGVMLTASQVGVG